MPRRGFLSLEQHFPYFAKNPEARKRFVGLGCCGKQMAKAPCEARAMYRGQYTRTCNEWIERNCEDWVILSAKHGVLAPDAVIEPYDLCLDRLSTEDQAKWARKVSRQLKKLFPNRKFICVNSAYGRLLDLEDLTLVFRGRSWGSQIQTEWLKNYLVLDDDLLRQIRQHTDLS